LQHSAYHALGKVATPTCSRTFVLTDDSSAQ